MKKLNKSISIFLIIIIILQSVMVYGEKRIVLDNNLKENIINIEEVKTEELEKILSTNLVEEGLEVTEKAEEKETQENIEILEKIEETKEQKNTEILEETKELETKFNEKLEKKKLDNINNKKDKESEDNLDINSSIFKKYEIKINKKDNKIINNDVKLKYKTKLDTLLENVELKYTDKSILEIENLKTTTVEDKEKANKKYRVIVEMTEKPVINEAIERNIDFQNLDVNVINIAKNRIRNQKDKFLNELDNKNINIEVENNYEITFNGITMELNYDEIDKLKENVNVKKIYISREYEKPQMITSSKLVKSLFNDNDNKYRGDGIVVAVIDTGIDYLHEAMVIDNGTKIKLNKQNVDEIIKNKNLKGKYFTDKIPYGYNYYDHNYNIFDSYGYMHGMHVAGIIGANSTKGGEIDGIAPNSQLLALKVFSDDPKYQTTFTDVWIKALDDAIALKADVINMSIGAAAGFADLNNDDPEYQAIERAKNAGINVIIAAGNDGNIMTGDYSNSNPLAENPDISVISSPAVTVDSISVASLENEEMKVPVLKYPTENGEKQARINLLSKFSEDKIVGQLIDVYDGDEEQYEYKDVKDKILFISIKSSSEKQETLTFKRKIEIALKHQPKGIIFYTDESMKDYLGRPYSIEDEIYNLPIAVISYKDWNIIKKLSYEINPYNVTINLKNVSMINPNAGKISEFSSWGPSPDLRIKPEITAPGGYIYSTAENNKYQNMSGTSMAAPHVSGAIAIIRQYLKEQGINGIEAVRLAKLMLMNTAKPIFVKPDIQEFVRKQGAGLINIKNAINSKLQVSATGTNDFIEDGKLELKQIGDKFTFNLKIKNLESFNRSFTPIINIYHQKQNTILKKNEIIDNDDLEEDKKILTYDIEKLNKITLDKITVGANDTFLFSHTISLSNMEENEFIEGYITLIEDVENSILKENLEINIPFLGFHGDWQSLKAIDPFENLQWGETKVKDAQFIINPETKARGSLFITPWGIRLPIINNIMYFSPADDEEKKLNGEMNYESILALRIAPLRNIDEIEFSILDSQTGELLRKLGKTYNIRKANRLDIKPPYVYIKESMWDGKIDGKYVTEDKMYIYQIKCKVNDGYGDKNQIYQYPVKIDSTKPVFIENDGKKVNVKKFDDLYNSISFEVQDEGTGLQYIYLESFDLKDLENKNEYNHENLKINANLGDEIEIPKNKREQYLKHIRIEFTDEYDESYPKIENNILNLTKEDLVLNEDLNIRVKVYRNGFTTGKLKINMLYIPFTPYLGISVTDKLSNSNLLRISNGSNINDSIHKLTFLDYDEVVYYNDGEIFVNDKKLERGNFIINGTIANVKINFPKKNVKINDIILDDRSKPSDEQIILIKNGKINDSLANDYNFKENYDENSDSFYVEFVINNIDSDLLIYTITKSIFKDDNLNLFKDFENNISHTDNEEMLVTIDTDELIFNNLLDDNKDLIYNYPRIFLDTPELVNIYTNKNLENAEIKVSGFIGNVNHSKIKEFRAYFVDENGDKITKEIVIDGKEFNQVKKDVNINEGLRYKGLGYDFDFKINVERFNSNLKLEVELENGQIGSIIRRFFYDKKSPEIIYTVNKRNLNSDEAIIDIIAKDDSFAINLYQNDSLIEKIDTSNKSLITNGTEVKKSIKVKLDGYITLIKLKAVDSVLNETNKYIGIFKSDR